MEPQLILGSSSPRRKSILQYFRIPFTCISSKFEEHTIPYQGDPIAYSRELAVGKAESIVKDHNPEGLILTADTVVVYKGAIFNKPNSYDEAIEMLKTLSGQTHSVITSVALFKDQKLVTGEETTQVTFTELPEEYLGRYVEAFSTLDKCGGYSIQEGGGLIIHNIQGCSYNVQGLPIKTLQHLLLEFNVNLWDYLV
ncbi:Maf-like protein [Chlamydia crocodili]|uniref:dTTP/UTP pyrophosphatase n=1 Tax=Chlamydia crocodili TaxID=2766982 RepID=A0ABX8CFW4_9CHLA|nr:Maf-like protein [Chlamydia crocodili]QVE48866.1 septum formation protein Maf [Chlamydia crocodili]